MRLDVIVSLKIRSNLSSAVSFKIRSNLSSAVSLKIRSNLSSANVRINSRYKCKQKIFSTFQFFNVWITIKA